VVLEPMVCDGDWLKQVQFNPYIESLLDKGLGKCVPLSEWTSVQVMVIC